MSLEDAEGDAAVGVGALPFAYVDASYPLLSDALAAVSVGGEWCVVVLDASGFARFGGRLLVAAGRGRRSRRASGR